MARASVTPTFSEDTGRPRSRRKAVLGAGGFGRSLPALLCAWAPVVVRLLEAGFETSKAIFELMHATLAGAKAPVQPDGTLNWNTAAHIMGTCLMGKDPKDSVVDGWGRCHDHENLFIAGSSVFATGTTANPTLTLAAITLCTVKEIHRQLRSRHISPASRRAARQKTLCVMLTAKTAPMFPIVRRLGRRAFFVRALFLASS